MIWQWKDGWYSRDLIADKGRVVLSIYESHGGGQVPTLEDENLLQAAPDLLSALKGLRALVIGECGTSIYECVDGERADAAIARAEGH